MRTQENDTGQRWYLKNSIRKGKRAAFKCCMNSQECPSRVLLRATSHQNLLCHCSSSTERWELLSHGQKSLGKEQSPEQHSPPHSSAVLSWGFQQIKTAAHTNKADKQTSWKTAIILSLEIGILCTNAPGLILLSPCNLLCNQLHAEPAISNNIMLTSVEVTA